MSLIDRFIEWSIYDFKFEDFSIFMEVTSTDVLAIMKAAS